MAHKAKITVIIPVLILFLLILDSSVLLAGDLPTIKFDCNDQGQCIRNPSGRYSDATCLNSCQPLLGTIKFGCNSDGQCVRDPRGQYTSAVCNSACQPTRDVEKAPASKSFSGAPQPRIPTEGLPNFGQLVAMIFTWSLNVLGIVVFVTIFYAGFRWFTAAGNTAQVNEAREKITNAITGAIILLAAWVILYTINPDLVGSSLTFPGIEPPAQQEPASNKSIQAIKFDCNSQGQCVRTPNGKFNDPACFNSCQPQKQN